MIGKRLFTVLVAMITVASVVLLPQSAHATFVANNVIDDSHFTNSNSMTAAQIDTFLNGFSASCLSSNNGFRTLDPLGWSSAQNKYLFGANVTAGKAIFDTAQLYSVNPQVILATMQKEQSLPTGGAGCYPNEPDPATATSMTNQCGSGTRNCTLGCTHSGGCMNIAMGYACPYYCDAKDEGFSMQLTLGTWLLRFAQQRAYGNLTGYVGYETGDEYFCYSGAMTAGNRQRSGSTNSCGGAPGNTMITYDGSYTTQDGTSIIVANGATSSMYYFTPFISGNTHFVTIFEGWFGPTQDGLVSVKNGGVYKVENGVKRAFPSEIVFLSYGYQWSGISSITASQIAQIPDGAAMTYNVNYRNGHLVASPSGGMYVVANGQKHPFPNQITFNSYFYTTADAFVITNAELGLIPDGAAMPYNVHYRDGHLMVTLGGGMYVVANGLKMPFPNQETFYSYSYRFSDASPITYSEASLIPDGAAMPYNVHYRDAKLVKSTNGGVYYVDTGQKRPFPDEATFFSYSYKWTDVINITSTEVSLIPDGTPMPAKP